VIIRVCTYATAIRIVVGCYTTGPLRDLFLVVADHLKMFAADLLDSILDVGLEFEVFRVRTQDFSEKGPLRALQEIVPIWAMLDREKGWILRRLFLQKRVVLWV
jgi:hypothetical protein